MTNKQRGKSGIATMGWCSSSGGIQTMGWCSSSGGCDGVREGKCSKSRRRMDQEITDGSKSRDGMI